MFAKFDGTKKYTKVAYPGNTVSAPFDLLEELISIVSPETNKRVASFVIPDIIRERQVEVILPQMFCKMIAVNVEKYWDIRLAPIFRITNCLPVNLQVAVSNKQSNETSKQEGLLTCQESFDVSALSLQDPIYLSVMISGFASSDKILIKSPKDTQLPNKITLKSPTGSIDLHIFRSNTHIGEVIIYAHSCIVNETGIPLVYYLKDKTPFPGTLETNLKGTIVFDNINELRLQTTLLDSEYTEEIPIESIGDRFVDVKIDKNADSQVNLGLNISSQICHNTYNLMTKVISIAPRYVIINETSHRLHVVQEKAEAFETRIEPLQRSIFHFDQAKLRKFIKFKIDSGKNRPAWDWSGSFDCTGEGDYFGLMRNEKNNQLCYVKVSIFHQSPTFYVKINEQSPDKAGLRIVNELQDVDLFVGQEGIPQYSTFVGRGSSVPFAWNEPCNYPEAVFVELIYDEKMMFNDSFTFDKVGECITLASDHKPKGQDRAVSICLEVTVEGSSKVMRIFNKKSRVSILRGWDISGTVNFETVGLSLVYSNQNTRLEMLYLSFNNVALGFRTEKNSLETQVRVQTIEVDNNISPRVLYPCTLYPENYHEKKFQYMFDLLIVSSLQNPQNQVN